MVFNAVLFASTFSTAPAVERVLSHSFQQNPHSDFHAGSQIFVAQIPEHAKAAAQMPTGHQSFHDINNNYDEISLGNFYPDPNEPLRPVKSSLRRANNLEPENDVVEDIDYASDPFEAYKMQQSYFVGDIPHPTQNSGISLLENNNSINLSPANKHTFSRQRPSGKPKASQVEADYANKMIHRFGLYDSKSKANGTTSDISLKRQATMDKVLATMKSGSEFFRKFEVFTDEAEDLNQVQPEKHFIVGYGSLIDKQSRKRTLGDLQEGGLQPITVFGWNRGFYTRSHNVGLNTTYLSTCTLQNHDADEPMPRVWFNAITFEVPEAALPEFDKREGPYNRRLVEVCDKESDDDCPNFSLSCGKYECAKGKYWLYESKPEHLHPADANAPIAQSYVDIFLNGCLETEKLFAEQTDFAANCIKSTTGWSKFWVNDRIYPRRAQANHERPTANLIDEMLAHHVPEHFKFIKMEGDHEFRMHVGPGVELSEMNGTPIFDEPSYPFSDINMKKFRSSFRFLGQKDFPPVDKTSWTSAAWVWWESSSVCGGDCSCLADRVPGFWTWVTAALLGFPGVWVGLMINQDRLREKRLDFREFAVLWKITFAWLLVLFALFAGFVVKFASYHVSHFNFEENIITRAVVRTVVNIKNRVMADLFTTRNS
eukprot:gene1224-744_t